MGYVKTVAAGDYMGTPDSAPVSFTTDFDWRIRLARADWKDGTCYLMGKLGSPPNKAFYLAQLASGVLYMDYTEDGTNAIGAPALGSVPPLVNGQPSWIRVTLDADGGAGGDGLFSVFYSTDGTNDPLAANWTASGTSDRGSAPTSIFDNVTGLGFGAYNNSGSGSAAKETHWYRMYLVNNGTVAFDADCTNLTPAEIAAAAFVEDSVNAATVSIAGPGWEYVPGGSPSLMMMGVG